MLGFLAISFLAGVLTVLAPCILPLLPVIIGGSLVEGAGFRRVFVIVLSLGASVLLFTLLLKASTAFISIPALFWQLLSGILLIFFGIVTVWPGLWDRIPGVAALYRDSNKLLGTGYQKKNIGGEIIMGAALGPVFSSCSPTYFVILAAVLPAHFGEGLTYLLAYVLGLCLFLFVIALLGQRAANGLGIVADPSGLFKKVIGALFLLVGIAIIFGLDKKIEAALPSGSFGEIGFEQWLLSLQTPGQKKPDTATTTPGHFLTLEEKASRFDKAPELVAPDGYLNTDGKPITLTQFVGKNVVLVDFWDYSCINCQRTFPYLKAWYEKYKDQGLVIVGVHTPEFAFEQLQSNVQDAAKRFGLMYPIVLDNKYQTWNAFQNQYWPRDYLIDIDGYIVHDHAGEGDYDVTERAIQNALAERAARLGTTLAATSTVDISQPVLRGVVFSPEIYFGSARNIYLDNGTPGMSGEQTFAQPREAPTNKLYFGGTWNIAPEYAEGRPGATILFGYNARDVYMVARNASASARIEVLRDGKPVGNAAGDDIDSKTSQGTIKGDRLYRLIHDATPGRHTIQVKVLDGTLDAYTFTFG